LIEKPLRRESKSKQTRSLRRIKWSAVIALLMLGLVTIAGLMLLASGRAPKQLNEMKAKVAAIAPRSRAERARAFEEAVATVITEPFPGEASAFGGGTTTGGGVSRVQELDGTVRIGLDVVDLNLWLHERLGAWLSNQGQALPSGVDGWLTVDEQLLRLSASDESRLGGRPVTLSLEPLVDEDGLLHLRIQSVRVGRMPLPVSTVAERIAGLNAMLGRLTTGGGVVPLWPIDDRRSRRLLSIETTPTQIWIRMKAEKRQ